MAKRTSKKAVTQRTSSRGRRKSHSSAEHISARSSGSSTRGRDYTEYRDMFFEFINRPAVKYVAGGLATAALARLASGISDRYPEISKFIRENMENMENKLSEFRSSEGIETEREASTRH